MFFTLAASEGLGPILGLWLVDKGTKWVARAGQSLSTVYYDCDAEYVEVGWEDTRSDTRNPASPSAVTIVETSIKLLVRRDNEVKELKDGGECV
ncbi:hypothetical protein NW762_011500 [Fusarium torreyae]|uniref:Uncharacterized protein n=1 Tax=Fusarium torreyae TaxID=1237075 RepID=A0A9W8VAL2_9HYPO|nr:hypothetical protein NW762_011500 [Fusarium torreyae]